MTIAQTNKPTPRKPLRLWPGILLAALQPLGWFVVPMIFPEAGFYGVLGTVAAGLGIVLWWLFFSRAPWAERLGVVLLAAAALYVTSRFLHVSIATAAMGMLFAFLSIPVVTFVFVVAVVASHRLAQWPRRIALATTVLVASGGWTLFRSDGIGGANPLAYLAWRWTPTAEERLLAQAGPLPVAPPPASTTANASEAPPAAEPAAAAAPRAAEPVPESSPAAVSALPDWPGFRGAGRNAVVRGVRIETDWSASPPVELWRRPVGPGWSSFAVHGDYLYTQEQRGEHEIVACYSMKTGEPVWVHRDAARFWEANAGPGPRGTPALGHGRVYTHGGTGIVNALDAATGAVLWSRNAADDTGAKLPYWAFASSPLVVDDLIVVAAAGSLVGYDAATGAPRWFGPKGSNSYSSPQLATISGVKQILMLSKGVVSVAPADGKVLWEHPWPGFTMVQPALTAEGDVLISDEGLGVRRLAVTHGPEGWTVQERWTSRGLKPYFNDYVIHNGHAYGFDGSILSCIRLEDGQRTGKGGRYGNGQMVLLSEQDLLLVLSEEGELALVKATPDQFTEIARLPAIEGKTWNHPVLVGDLLLVRNGEQMAAFRLRLTKQNTDSRTPSGGL